MTETQKLIKYSAIALAAVLIAGIIGGIVGAVAGLSWIFGGESGVAGEHKTYTVSQDIRNLDMEINAAAVRIELGNEFKVDSNHKYLKVSEKNGRLILEETRKLIHTTDYDQVYVTLTVPESVVFDRVEISTDAGTVDIEKLQANNLELELGAGTANISDLTVFKRAEIEGGTGDIVLADADIADLKLEMGVGKISFAGKLTGNSDLSFGVGEANISLAGSLADYRITFHKGLGEGHLEGEKNMENNGTYGTGSSLIVIDGGIGDCNINFVN